MDKKEYFEAFLSELLIWYKTSVSKTENDLSKLKVLKLLFLGVSNNKKYLDIFDNFMAWDLGPVEKDIYLYICDKSLNKFEISNNCLTIKNNLDNNLSKDSIEFAKDVISFLKLKNKNLISFSASSLVDITHKWDCWLVSRMFFNEKISRDLILSSKKYYI